MLSEISIHALQAESDCPIVSNLCTAFYFNPRSPSGERLLQDKCFQLSIHQFQSTLSKRRATLYIFTPFFFSFISIHALQAESDMVITSFLPFLRDFNPRSPSGERLQKHCVNRASIGFQSTLSKRRATANNMHFLPELSLKSHNCCEILDKRNNLY